MVSSLLTAAVAAGCATAASETPTNWRLPNGQSCYRFESDSPPLALTDLLDVSAFQAAMAELPELRTAAGDTVLLDLAYDSTGVRSRSTASHARVSRATLEQVEVRLQELSAEHGPPNRSARGILIRAEPPQVHSYAVQWGCEPALVNREEVERSLRRLYRLAGPEVRRVVLWMRIDESGVPAEVRVHRSSGLVATDAELVRVGWTARFAPAVYDGHLPVSAWVQLPLSIREAPAARGPAEPRR